MRCDCGNWLDQCGFGRNLGGRHRSSLLPRTLPFGLGALVLAGGFVGGELASTSLALPLDRREFSSLGHLMIPFMLSSTAPLPCKTLLLLLGVIGLAATLLEIEEGHVTLPIQKL